MKIDIKPQDLESISFKEFEQLIKYVLFCPEPPEKSFFKAVTEYANKVLDSENADIRPPADDNKPGGLINLSSSENIVILPDLHARRKFFYSLLRWKFNHKKNILQQLETENFTLLCLGDGVHAEGELAVRWVKAYNEFISGYKKHSVMDEEISDSFNLMTAVMFLKIRYRDKVHFLKGNHENILNETSNGNFSFAKFANEGAMVYEYFKKFYGEELIKAYYNFERKLPLFVVGTNFLASHAEPGFSFDRERIVNYHEDSELIEALTWTENFSSAPGTLDKIFNVFLPKCSDCYYFGGHRPIKTKYHLINNDRYVQIHNPYKQIAVVINKNKNINLDTDILEIPDYHSEETEEPAAVEIKEFDFTEYFEEE